MADFVGYACWDSSSVSRTIKTEAITPSDAVFLATHSPLRIRRQRRLGDELSDESLISEEQLVREFLDAPAQEGFLVAPVLGDSGTGKSHLVRWASATIERTEDRAVIYLPKERTGLRDVIEELLAFGSGPIIDEIRGQISKLGAGIDQEQLEHRLLNELAEAVRTAEPKSPFEKALVGQDKLHALLHDPFFLDHFVAPASFVNRRAMHAMGVVSPDSGEVPLQFTRDDLPIDISGVRQASAKTRDVYRQMVSQPPMQQAAIDLLNRHVDVAVMRATELGVGQLQKAFLQIRRELAGRREIILLIEDFALIQGVQRDLLDAIVQAGEVRGQQTFATVRTLMAVTPGYYRDELPATFQTRAQATSPLYELDVALTGKGSLSKAEISTFVGKYLNAARLGTEALESAQIPRGEAIPNKCSSCPFHEECFASFGSSADGYGLYPYNHAALERVVFGSTLPEQPANFNPRRVLSQVVRSVLADQVDDIRQGQFPGPAFKQTFAQRSEMAYLAPEVGEVLVETLGDAEARRMVTVLEYWGGAPQELVDVPDGIRSAFQLPEIPLDSVAAWSGSPAEGKVSGERSDDEASGAESDPAREALDPSLKKRLKAIDDWVRLERDLPQDVARELRSIVVRAVMGQISWVNPVMKVVPASRTKRIANQASTISIEGAKESLGAGVQPLHRFKRDDPTAVFFKALLLMATGKAREAERARIRLDSLASELAPKAQLAIIEELQFDDPLLEAVMMMLLDGASVCGKLASGSTLLDQVNALFWDGTRDDRGDRPWRLPQWIELEEEHLRERPAVVALLKEAVGTAQGSGAVHAIDFIRVKALLKQAIKKRREGTLGDPPDWAKKAARPLERLRAVLEDQVVHFQDHIRLIRVLVPRGTSYKDTVDAIAGATSAGQSFGLVLVPSREMLSTVHERNKEAASLDFRSVEALERSIERLGDSSVGDTLAVIGADFGDGPPRILEYLKFSDEWILKGQHRAEAEGAHAASDLDHRIQATVERWEALAGAEGGN